MTDGNKNLLRVLKNQMPEKIPFWLMRQAGRYLPEYRELRAEAGGFLDLVYHSERASEVTLQPIRRFGMDAAILFSDILVIPQALGQNLKFETGEGPKLNALTSQEDINNLDLENIDDVLNPVYETVRLTREKLSGEGFNNTALIGFCGSPWTVACYMIEGGGSKDFAKVKKWAEESPDSFQSLIDKLVASSIHYLSKQIEAGAEAIQLFDSWSGLLDGEEDFIRWSVEPTKRIVNAIKDKYPNMPIIGFPRGCGKNSLLYARETGINAIGMDYDMDKRWAAENLQSLVPVQGNLHPETLLKGGAALEKEALEILETFSDKPFIFNLGHGVIKETPPEHVQQLTDIIRNFER